MARQEYFRTQRCKACPYGCKPMVPEESVWAVPIGFANGYGANGTVVCQLCVQLQNRKDTRKYQHKTSKRVRAVTQAVELQGNQAVENMPDYKGNLLGDLLAAYC